MFNAKTYLTFLEQVAGHYYPRRIIWIQDNASYHQDADVWEWFASNRAWWTVANLPPYSPELNAVERLWTIRALPERTTDTSRTRTNSTQPSLGYSAAGNAGQTRFADTSSLLGDEYVSLFIRSYVLRLLAKSGAPLIPYSTGLLFTEISEGLLHPYADEK